MLLIYWHQIQLKLIGVPAYLMVFYLFFLFFTKHLVLSYPVIEVVNATACFDREDTGSSRDVFYVREIISLSGKW